MGFEPTLSARKADVIGLTTVCPDYTTGARNGQPRNRTVFSSFAGWCRVQLTSRPEPLSPPVRSPQCLPARPFRRSTTGHRFVSSSKSMSVRTYSCFRFEPSQTDFIVITEYCPTLRTRDLYSFESCATLHTGIAGFEPASAGFEDRCLCPLGNMPCNPGVGFEPTFVAYHATVLDQSWTTPADIGTHGIEP